MHTTGLWPIIPTVQSGRVKTIPKRIVCGLCNLLDDAAVSMDNMVYFITYQGVRGWKLYTLRRIQHLCLIFHQLCYLMLLLMLFIWCLHICFKWFIFIYLSQWNTRVRTWPSIWSIKDLHDWTVCQWFDSRPLTSFGTKGDWVPVSLWVE